MTGDLKVEIQQIVISPRTNGVEVVYEIILENSEFTGKFGWGRVMIPHEEPACQQVVTSAVDILEKQILKDVGLRAKQQESEELLDESEEEDLL